MIVKNNSIIMSIPVASSCCSMSVSYTHLDVYKRQNNHWSPILSRWIYFFFNSLCLLHFFKLSAIITNPVFHKGNGRCLATFMSWANKTNCPLQKFWLNLFCTFMIYKNRINLTSISCPISDKFFNSGGTGMTSNSFQTLEKELYVSLFC